MGKEPMLPPTYHASPAECAESVSELVQRGFRFTACIHGPYGSGKTSALVAIINAANDLGVGFEQIAAFAPWPAISRLHALTGHRLLPEYSGTPIDAMYRYTAMPGSNRRPYLPALLPGYLDKIATINDITPPYSDSDRQFLNSVTPRLQAAIQADHEARLADVPLPKNAYLDSVARYVADYKRRRGLYDKADLIAGNYYACRRVRLLVLDEVDADDAAILPRYFPNASIVAASRQPIKADVVFALPSCLRQPECVELEPCPVSAVPPPSDDFASLFVLAPPWRRKVWTTWLREHGLPHPARLNRWPAEHAGAVLARFDRLHDFPAVRLGLPFAVRGIEAEIVIADQEAWLTDEAREIAMSRATRKLVIRKSDRVAKPPAPAALPDSE